MITLWMIIGIMFLIGEVFTPGFYLFCVAVGCFVASASALFTASLSIQILAFSVGLVLAMLLLRPVMNRFFSKRTQRTNVDRLPGRVVKVERAISAGEKGRVTVDGESWLAESDSDIAVGEKARILEVAGTTLRVEKVL